MAGSVAVVFDFIFRRHQFAGRPSCEGAIGETLALLGKERGRLFLPQVVHDRQARVAEATQNSVGRHRALAFAMLPRQLIHSGSGQTLRLSR
jgi:hypothetical protein